MDSLDLKILFVAAGVAAAVFAQEAPKKELTARELFYSAATAPQAVTPKAPAAAVNRTAKRVPAVETAAAPSNQAATHPQSPASRPVDTSSAPPSASIVLTADHRPSSATAPTSGPALGLKYSILKRIGNDMVEVPNTTVFRAGDRIQFRVETNLPGYLYIISRGSSGTWKPMFPSPEVADGDNRVEGLRAYTMPPGTRIVFDEQTGAEKIFIVFSRAPEQDLEKVIYSLQSPKAAPAAVPDAPPPSRKLLQVASLRIDDTTVGRLRGAYSRDLIIEKVDPNTPGEKKETAVYVVNPTGSASSRVVADISLVHQ